MNGEFRLHDIYLHHAAHTDVDATLVTTSYDDPRSTYRSRTKTSTIDLDNAGASVASVDRRQNRCNFEIKNQNADEDVTINHLTVEIELLGEQEA